MSDDRDKPRLLIADDSRLIRISARKILGEEFDLLEAEDGEQAWDKLSTDPDIQALFTDLGMPNLDGYGLLGRIRKSMEPRLRDLPVIVVTGNEGDEARQEALDNGATDFVSKPFDSISLIARARSHTRLGQISREARALEEHVTIDALTGLGNQRAYVDALRQERSFALRHDQPMSLLLLELGENDDIVNALGRRPASELIRVVGNALREVVREEDTGARIATSRFAIVAPACGPDGIGSMAARVLEAVRGARDGADGVTQILRIAGLSPAMDREIKLKDIVAAASAALSAMATDTDGIELLTEGPIASAPPPEPEVFDEDEPAPSMDLEQALACLARGDQAAVEAQLSVLLKRMSPLLGLAGRRARDDLLSLIAQSTSRSR